MIPNIEGYHCNDKARCQDFISKGTDIKSEDTNYLGYGMYFWDNPANADYWSKEMLRKKQEVSAFWIVKSNILLDSMLDLTDTDVVDGVDRLWNKYWEKNGKDIRKEIPIGQKIDILFKYYDMLAKNYGVIKAYVSYPATPDNFFFPKRNPDKIQLVNTVKTMYCVRDSSKIVNRLFLKEILRK